MGKSLIDLSLNQETDRLDRPRVILNLHNFICELNWAILSVSPKEIESLIGLKSVCDRAASLTMRPKIPNESEQPKYRVVWDDLFT